MRRSLIILFAAVLLAAPSFAFVDASEAKMKSSVEFVLGNDFFTVGQTIELREAVRDDAFLAGANILVSKKVANDLVAVGSSILLIGEIGDDVRAAGESILLSGVVGGDAILAGALVQIGSDAVIGGDALIAGAVVNFSGVVDGDLKIFGEEIVFAGNVAGDVSITAGESLVFADGARIAGKLIYTAKEELELPPRLAAAVEYRVPTEIEKALEKHFVDAAFFFKIFLAAIAFVTGAVLLAFFGSITKIYTNNIRQRFWRSLLVGAALFAVPLLVMLLFVSAVGALLGVILLLAWILMLLAASALAGFAIGSLILKPKPSAKYRHKLFVLAVGMIVIAAIGLIPQFGGLLQFVIFVFSFGALATTKFDLYKLMRKAKLA